MIVKLKYVALFQGKVVNKSSESYFFSNLSPYTKYSVIIYSVIINQNGNEERSLPIPKSVLVFAIGKKIVFCYFDILGQL